MLKTNFRLNIRWNSRQTGTLVTIALGIALLVSFNNCQGNHDVTAATVEQQSVCKADFQKLFENTYYAHVRKAGSCVECHAEGGLSPYPFAANDPVLAFSQFNAVTKERMAANAVDPAHSGDKGKNVTGPQQQSAFDTLLVFWELGVGEYNSCMAAQAPNVGDLKQTTGHVFDTIYFSSGASQTYTWDLSNPLNLDRGFPIAAKLQMTVSIYYEGTVAKGYTFSNPRMFAQTGEDEVVVEGFYVTVNDRVITDLPTWATAKGFTRGIDGLVNGTSATSVAPGAVTVPLDTITSLDKISLVAGRLYTRPRQDNPPNPADPVMAATNAFSANGNVTFTVTGDTPNARRWCFSNTPVRPASANQPCVGGAAANVANTLNGWYTTRPSLNNYNLTMHYPTLVPNQTYTLYLYVADFNLKINNNASSITFTYDPVAPVAPIVSSLAGAAPVTVKANSVGSDVQVVPISLTHPDEGTVTLSWCVREGSDADALGNSGNCTPYTTTKPTYVSLTAGANRQIVAFVRDPAGNRSTGSTPAFIKNTNGVISYAQLYIGDPNTTSTSRSALSNNCFSCHDASMAGAQPAATAKLQLSVGTATDHTGYNAAFAKKTEILSIVRTGKTSTGANHNGGANTYLNGDVVALKLLELWLSQTTPAEL